MKHIKKLSFSKSSLFVGLTIFSTYITLPLKAGSLTTGTLEERVQELKTRVPPEVIIKTLAENIYKMSKTVDLTAEERQELRKKMEKLQQLMEQKKKTDKFTQSEAHLSLPSILKLIENNYPNLDPYLNIIASVIVKEQEFKNTHYAFYHGHDNTWRVPQDLYRKLYERLDPLSQKIENFEFIRWNLPKKIEKSTQEFVVEQLKRYGLIDDTKEEDKLFLLSVNLALFGNVGFHTESTWEYFMNPESHVTPAPFHFEGLLDTFGISHKYIDKLMNIAYLLQTKEQTLLQILIPKEIVDYVSYLSFASGMPADKNTMGWILDNVKRRKKYHKPHKYMDAFREITEIFREEQEENALFKELLERAEEGDFSINELLKIYRNNPQKIDNINYLEARLVFTKNILTTPGIGIKFIRYDTIQWKRMKEYNQKLDEIVDQMVQELLSKATQEKVEETKTERTLVK